MKNLNSKLNKFIKIYISILIIILVNNTALSNEINLQIEGNEFIDNDVILSLIKNKPTDLSEEYSNYLIKTLDNSQLFEKVSVKIENKKYILNIKEFSNLNKIFFQNNERLKDEELEIIISELKLNNLNPSVINQFIDEVTKIYNTFGYNNINITYREDIFLESNTANLYFDFNEGTITKINNITFNGNNNINSQTLKSAIKSKTKSLRNIFANNNFKKFSLDQDKINILNFYKNNGFLDIKVKYNVEYLESNRVNILFEITEGEVYKISSIEILDKDSLLNSDIITEVEDYINNSIFINDIFSIEKIDNIKTEVSNIIFNNGLEFFEILLLDKKTDNSVDILFQISSVEPQYVKQINIYGNTRTYDYVIRRELELYEGDPFYQSQLNKIKNKLKKLNLFNSVEVIQKDIEGNIVDLEIKVEEKQTGTVNAGVSVGTLDGFSLVAGLSERNFYGTGRSLDALINTSEDKTEFTFRTTDRIFYDNDVDISYNANYKEENFSKVSSYNLDTFTTGLGLGYSLTPKVRHKISLDYVIKDYKVTNTDTVASSIANSSGENTSFILSNNLFYSTLNSRFLPNNGESLNYFNSIETPTSSSNGYIKNILTLKNYKMINKNVFSAQARIGNIFSLNNNEILSDDKFSLGGRWLRGFDNFGAGPRNSRTSYVGGNNLIVTKFDYSREINDNSNFPILLNVFNDYGLLWENKTSPTHSNNSIRSSVGLGIRYYSPIGPIGFSWGFPISHEEYDIKRMFLFSVGVID